MYVIYNNKKYRFEQLRTNVSNLPYSWKDVGRGIIYGNISVVIYKDDEQLCASYTPLNCNYQTIGNLFDYEWVKVPIN